MRELCDTSDLRFDPHQMKRLVKFVEVVRSLLLAVVLSRTCNMVFSRPFTFRVQFLDPVNRPVQLRR